MTRCAPDRVLGLVTGDRLHRLSFSRSLITHVRDSLMPDARVESFGLRLGRELRPGDATPAGLFAVRDRRRGTVLRVQVSRELAHYLADDPSRFVSEAWLTRACAAL